MLSSVSNPLAAAAGLPLASDEAPGVAARRAPLPRGGGAILLPAVVAGATAAAKAAAGASPASAKPKARSSAAGYAKAASSTASTSGASAVKPTSTAKASTARSKASAAKKSGPLAFLDDPKLSVEEKLLQLLAHLNDKWNKDLDKKMKELKTDGGAAPKSTGGGASSTKPKSSGLSGALGSIVSVAKQVLPQVGIGLDLLQSPLVRSTLSSVSGPALAALATATGFPELAPLALRYGPEIVEAAADAAGSAGKAAASPGAKTSGGGGSTSSPAATASAIGSDRDAQLKLMEIQRIMDQQKEMFSLTSNLLRTGHETRMAVIQNVR